MRLRLHPAASKELHEATDWYLTEANSQTAANFVAEFERASAVIQDHPLIGSPSHAGTRRWLFRSFPYSIVYRVTNHDILVIALAHYSRRPEYWAARR
jgi:plasmid stabilization system protein ParE